MMTQLLWVALSGRAPPTPEQAWAQVPVQVDPCVDERGIDRTQLAYLVANELEGTASAAAARLVGEGAALVVACTGEGVVADVVGPNVAHTEVRTAGLERTVATRTVALAIVEMVTELPVAPPVVVDPPVPEVRPEPPPPDEPRPAVATPLRTTWILRAGAEALGFPLAPLGLFGGAVDVRHRPGRRIGWLVGLAVHGGRDRESIGTVRALAGSGTVAAAIHGAQQRVDPHVALGVRGGVVALRGVADDAAVKTGRVRGSWLGPVVRGGVDGFVGRRAVVGVHLELGWAALATRARVEGRAGAGAAGLWLGGGVAVGWRVLRPATAANPRARRVTTPRSSDSSRP